ncbi:GDP-mannose-dependent alpha-(1-6)-phosphatidylinositol monomannoside mannosyltransferase [uncultured Roseburia sp.]|uniref:Glycosyltransferase family 4 protein n=1 Tax=Brotonthovivens ammoniilytica TaxID=2981725 RepID=A0ABT2TF48_9FIRM|nr:glycosyltransferase family 4 protein [Brotonthovivens ammoniilytica]MCU6760809.1 glycosyltransferase family 4 protein [Brotonthovivens ammoniilytica]SCI09963.1 GDP-mannose-dependent alpha-(1-6)-phosphatidylinositol monomannoside mannosyltransferase [uncultured Roseburia sp.]
MKEKVLIITTISGFLHQFEMNNVKLLQKAGYEVHYASNFQVPVYTYDETEYESMGIVTHHVPIEKSPRSLKENKEAFRQLVHILEEEQISLIHCHTPMGGVLGRLSGQRAAHNVKVIYTAHGFHFYKGASWKNWLLYYQAERWLARKTDMIITINQEDFNYASEFRLKTNGCVYKIPGVGLDLKRFFPISEKRSVQREKLKIAENCFCIITAASLDVEKNHETVLRAISLIPDKRICYLICGDGPQREYLEKLVRKLHLETQVYFMGFQEHMEELLHASDCFVFPSLREGLGMAALEAMACGLPVIAAGNRGTREYMKNGENGFLCEGEDAGQFARAIETLKADRMLCQRMGAVGRQTAEQFGTAKTEVIMSQVYQRIQGEMKGYEWNRNQYHHGSVQSKGI